MITDPIITQAREILATFLNTNPVITSTVHLVTYAQLTIIPQTPDVESFHALYLDNKNRLIEDHCHAVGTVNHVPVYPREIARRAILCNASAVILVHNHPSGDPTPSNDDVTMTRLVKKALSAVGITLHDHFVIAPTSYVSLTAEGFI